MYYNDSPKGSKYRHEAIQENLRESIESLVMPLEKL